MVREFSYSVYDTNGATPKQNAINHMNARAVAQNNLAKLGGGLVPVPQFSSNGQPPVSPNNSNAMIQRTAELQLKMDNTEKLQSNTGQPKGGGPSKKRMKNKKSKKSKRSKRTKK
jgi:hypothetical protein